MLLLFYLVYFFFELIFLFFHELFELMFEFLLDFLLRFPGNVFFKIITLFKLIPVHNQAKKIDNIKTVFHTFAEA